MRNIIHKDDFTHKKTSPKIQHLFIIQNKNQKIITLFAYLYFV